MPDPLYGEVRTELIAHINSATRVHNIFVAFTPLISAFGMIMPWSTVRILVLATALGFCGGGLIMCWATQRVVRDWARRLDEIAGRLKLPTISTHPFQRQTTRVLLFLAVQLLVDVAFIVWLATGGVPPVQSARLAELGGCVQRLSSV